MKSSLGGVRVRIRSTEFGGVCLCVAGFNEFSWNSRGRIGGVQKKCTAFGVKYLNMTMQDDL